ncbi:hypothetical protein AB0B78_02795 [Streptomyces sp. NPDC040724]|uniref:hypothetical protein n=1 Tax=unclassified Streptomyces TaxID=2593676 RepID=UPI0034063632
MRPDAYAALYGPWQPAQQVRVPVGKDRRGVVALAALLWVVTALSVSVVGGLLSIALIWGAAAGQPIGELVPWLLPLPAGAVGLTALARAPGIRRLAASSRLLLLGALACPVPTVLAVWLWFLAG